MARAEESTTQALAEHFISIAMAHNPIFAEQNESQTERTHSFLLLVKIVNIFRIPYFLIKQSAFTTRCSFGAQTSREIIHCERFASDRCGSYSRPPRAESNRKDKVCRLGRDARADDVRNWSQNIDLRQSSHISAIDKEKKRAWRSAARARIKSTASN